MLNKIVNRLFLNTYSDLERKLYLAGKLRFKICRGFIVRENGFELRKNSSDISVFNQIFVEEEYKKVISLLSEKRIISTSPILLDIGANIGLSALYFQKKIKDSKVYAFEPFASNFKRIPSSINSFQYGLWSNDTQLEVRRDFRDGKEWSVQVVEDENGSIEGKSLKSILLDLGLERVDLLKVDIEGSEFEVFLNDEEMSQNLEKVKAVVIEIHDECGDRNELTTFFNLVTLSMSL